MDLNDLSYPGFLRFLDDMFSAVLQFFLFAGFLFACLNLSHKARRPLPPGPPGRLPILGHLFSLPTSQEWLTYRRWSVELGTDIICLDVLGSHVIVLNSLKAVSELFDGKARLYSDRPDLFALKTIFGFHWVLGLMPYGKEFLQARKAANKYLNQGAIKQYQQLQLNSTRKCLRDLLNHPDEYLDHLRRMAGHTILGVTYGLDPRPEDPYMHTVFMATRGINLALSTRALVYDLLPFVKWLPDWVPGLGLWKDAQQFTHHISVLPDIPLQSVREAMEKGTAPPSIAASMIAGSDLPENLIRSVTGSMYLAGTEAPVATIANFLLAMIKYPETQQKAQAEIDSVIGDRLPDFKDEALLPYTNALIKEVWRWRNVSPLATPHRLITDDVYKGFLLPKDSIVIGNVYAIMHDESLFPDPDTFKPERYLDPSAKSLDVLFGFGSRVCPGRYLARSAVWITILSILSTFEVSKYNDEGGNVIEPSDEEFTSGVVSFPLPFKCKIVPRSLAARTLALLSAEQ